MKNRRLEFLRNRHRETYNAVMWLRENRHKFSGPIYEPILLQARKRYDTTIIFFFQVEQN